jgi:hypothetical protein
MRKLLAVAASAAALGLLASPAAAGDKADEVIAKKAVLKRSDVPDGWQRDAETGEEVGTQTGVPECKTFDRANKAAAKEPHAESPNFSDPDDPFQATTVESVVFVFPSAKAAKRYLAVYAADDLLDCFDALASDSLPGAGDVGVSELEVTGGDQAVGLEIEIVADDGTGTSMTFTTDVFVVRAGRGIVGFSTQTANRSLPFASDLLDTLVSRLERAL